MKNNDIVDNSFIEVANKIAESSKCKKAQVGAVIINDNYQIVGSGFNHTVEGVDDCCENSENKTVVEVMHAEVTAILDCAKKEISPKGKIMYCSYAPCVECAKVIIESGVKCVYYRGVRRVKGILLLRKVGIDVIRVPRLG